MTSFEIVITETLQLFGQEKARYQAHPIAASSALTAMFTVVILAGILSAILVVLYWAIRLATAAIIGLAGLIVISLRNRNTPNHKP